MAKQRRCITIVHSRNSDIAKLVGHECVRPVPCKGCRGGFLHRFAAVRSQDINDCIQLSNYYTASHNPAQCGTVRPHHGEVEHGPDKAKTARKVQEVIGLSRQQHTPVRVYIAYPESGLGR